MAARVAADGDPPTPAGGAPPQGDTGLNKLLNQPAWTGLTFVLTIYALFGDDIKIAACPLTDDGYPDSVFNILTIICLVVFVFEIGAQAACKAGYVNSFYFWLDVISTLSLLPDITWFGAAVGLTSSTDALSTARSSRAATKAGRVVRIVRLVRLVRLARLYKMKKDHDDRQEEDDVGMTIEDKINLEPSKVGKRMAELTTKRVIVIVLTMIVMIPILEGTALTTDSNTYQEDGFAALHRTTAYLWARAGKDEAAFLDDHMLSTLQSEALNNFVANSYDGSQGPLIHMQLYPWGSAEPDEADVADCDNFNPDTLLPRKCVLNHWLAADNEDCDDCGSASRVKLGNQDNYETLYRIDELHARLEDTCYEFLTPAGETCDVATFASATCNPVNAYADGENTCADDGDCEERGGSCVSGECVCPSIVIFSMKETTEGTAVLSIVKTLFIMVILVYGVISFSNVAQTMAVDPIERMMELVKSLAENPLGKAEVKLDALDEAAAAEQAIKEGYETALLENTLSKIGSLLQVGFGVAGADIIAGNMAEGDLNVMIPGKRITSVFGFGIIESFTETCTCLEEDIVTYINTIAWLIHDGAHMWHGAANKNIGCAFLLVWKICDGQLPGLRDPRDPKPDAEGLRKLQNMRENERSGITMPSRGNGKVTRQIAPQEIVDSAMTSMLKMRVEVYHANHNGTLNKFRNNRNMVECFGPAFEVHMGFGLHIGWAIEGAIGSRFKIDASYLSPNVNMAARLEAATHQFGCPMLMSGFVVEEMSEAAQRMCRLIDIVTVKGSKIPLHIWTFDIINYPEGWGEPTINAKGEQEPADFITPGNMYEQLQAGMDANFRPTFEAGVQAYIAGHWSEAKDHLERAKEIFPDDGPTKLLLRIMMGENFTAPADWEGFRELTEK